MASRCSSISTWPGGRSIPPVRSRLGLGGTTDYASPEQRAAMASIRQGRPIRVPVDGRSDIYSLGVLLYEALGGSRPGRGKAVARLPLDRLNPQVSAGLSDIIHKCLRSDPRDRYPNAAALAGDLRRHLNHLPLRGRAEPQSDRTLAEVAAAAAVGAAPPGVSCAVGRRGDRGGRTAPGRLSPAGPRTGGGAEQEPGLPGSRAIRPGRRHPEARPGPGRVDPRLRDAGGGCTTRSCAWSSGTARPPSSTGSRTWSGSAMAWRRNRPRKRTRCSHRGREIWEARGLLLGPIPGRREPELEQRIRTDLLDIITDLGRSPCPPGPRFRGRRGPPRGARAARRGGRPARVGPRAGTPSPRLRQSPRAAHRAGRGRDRPAGAADGLGALRPGSRLPPRSPNMPAPPSSSSRPSISGRRTSGPTSTRGSAPTSSADSKTLSTPSASASRWPTTRPSATSTGRWPTRHWVGPTRPCAITPVRSSAMTGSPAPH